MNIEQQGAANTGSPAGRVPDVPALVRVKKSFFFRKRSRDDAFAQLGIEIRLGKNPPAAPPRLQGKPADEVLLETCRLVGRHEGIAFKAPFANAGSALTPLDRILRVSNVRAQTVALPSAW
jgi:hypothetical protein